MQNLRIIKRCCLYFVSSPKPMVFRMQRYAFSVSAATSDVNDSDLTHSNDVTLTSNTDSALVTVPDASELIVSHDFFQFLPVDSIGTVLHSCGLPLWLGIAASCIVIRIALLPLLFIQQRNAARLQSNTDAARSLGLLRYLFFQDTDTPLLSRMYTYQRASRAIRRRAGHSLLRSAIYPITQLPVFFTLTFSIRQLLAIDPLMSSGGTLWFHNLAMKDLSMVLPLCAIAMTYATLESTLAATRVKSTVNNTTNTANEQAVSKENKPSLGTRFIGWCQTAMLISLPFLSQMPAGVFMYWLPSSAWTMAQSKALRDPGVRRWFGFRDDEDSSLVGAKIQPGVSEDKNVAQKSLATMAAKPPINL